MGFLFSVVWRWCICIYCNSHLFSSPIAIFLSFYMIWTASARFSSGSIVVYILYCECTYYIIGRCWNICGVKSVEDGYTSLRHSCIYLLYLFIYFIIYFLFCSIYIFHYRSNSYFPLTAYTNGNWTTIDVSFTWKITRNITTQLKTNVIMWVWVRFQSSQGRH